MLDRLLSVLDFYLERGLEARPQVALPVPLSIAQQRKLHAWVRLHHAGEVCAQGLLLGGILMAKHSVTSAQFFEMLKAEYEHLQMAKAWLSVWGDAYGNADGLWFFGGLLLAMRAGLEGDVMAWHLVEATERRVILHMQESLDDLSDLDPACYAWMKTLLEDEIHHQNTAQRQGLHEEPSWMSCLSLLFGGMKCHLA